MKYKVFVFRFLISLFFVLGFMVNSTTAQVSIKFGGGIGIMSPASDFSGSTLEYYNGSNYGLSSGLNLHGKAKFGFAALNLTTELDYSSLNNTGNSEPGQGKVNISQKIISLKVGPEFRFSMPALPLTSHIGANLALNSFSGETTFQGVSKVPSATYNVNAVTRLGIGFSAGAEVSVTPLLSLDFNISYNLMNISGKEWEDVKPATDQRIDSYLSLNDGRDPGYTAGDDEHFIASERSIHALLFTVSILFGL